MNLMLLRHLLIASTLVMLSTGTGCGPSESAESLSAQLLETDRAFAARSVASSPADAFDSFLAEEAIQLPNGSEPISGRESIVTAMQAGPSFSLDWDPQHAEASASGDLGWTWGTYVATFVDSTGSERTSTGKYLNVWRRQPGGSWKVIADMGNQP